MVTVQLDLANEEQLQELAKRHGQDIGQLATHIIQTYLDAQGWSPDSAEQWAEASAALTAEVYGEEQNWTDGESVDGSE